MFSETRLFKKSEHERTAWYELILQPFHPGANPMIVSYNASGVKIYNATGSLVRFEAKLFSSSLKKRSRPLAMWW
jgi:hypothetical protein